jgi:DNA-binding XRE family transcriptional regulator
MGRLLLYRDESTFNSPSVSFSSSSADAFGTIGPHCATALRDIPNACAHRMTELLKYAKASDLSMRGMYSMLTSTVKDAYASIPYAIRMERLGDRIKMLREARGLSQTALGDLVGVTRSAVAQWEDGSSENIKLETFLKLCDELRTDPHYLVFGPKRTSSQPGDQRESKKLQSK